MAKMLSPKEYKILYNIAVVLKFLHKDAEALEYMKLAQENIIKGQEKMAEHLLKEYKAQRYQLLK